MGARQQGGQKMTDGRKRTRKGGERTRRGGRETAWGLFLLPDTSESNWTKPVI